MKRLLLLAFLIQLTGGQNLLIRDAVGFAIIERDKVWTHVFFDRETDPLMAIPSALIQAALYVPDNQVM